MPLALTDATAEVEPLTLLEGETLGGGESEIEGDELPLMLLLDDAVDDGDDEAELLAATLADAAGVAAAADAARALRSRWIVKSSGSGRRSGR